MQRAPVGSRLAFKRNAAAALFGPPAAACAGPREVKVGVPRIERSRDAISILDIPAADDFVAGAKLAMADDDTTGKFLKALKSIAVGSYPRGVAIARR